MLTRHNITFPLGRKHIATTVAVFAAVNLFILLAMYLHRTGTLGSDWRVDFFTGEFNLAGENKLSVWYSSMLLLLVSLGALGCFALELQQRQGTRERVLSYGWALVALLFVGLSLDELGSIHERIPELPGMYSPAAGLPGWVGVLVVPIALVGLFIVAFALLRVRQSPAAFWLMLLGLLLFLSVPIQEHFEVAAMMAADSTEASRRPAAAAVLEEGTEVFGSLCFLASTLLYLRMLVRRSSIVTGREAEEQVSLTITPWMGVATAALLAFGLAVVEFGLLRRITASGPWGNPRNWFPSALAFIAALLALGTWQQVRRARYLPSAFAFLLLAFVCLVVSADHGNGHKFTQQLWSAQPTRNLLVNTGYAVAVLLSAAAVMTQPLPGRIRWLFGTWAVLLVVGILTRSALLAPFSFAAFAILLPTLLHTARLVSGSLPRVAVLSPNLAETGTPLDIEAARADLAPRQMPS